MNVRLRPAHHDDLPAITALMERATAELQRGFLDDAQIAASHAVMGLDTQLVRDGTYFVAECDNGALVGCGGWSRRATPFGGDDSAVPRDARLLDPVYEAARVRAMYTDPAHARRGIGRAILAACEAAARAAGFVRAELTATLSGVPLYRACGYQAGEPITVEAMPGVLIPLIRMERRL